MIEMILQEYLKLSDIITLKNLALPYSPARSTVRHSLAGAKGKARSFSMPLFLHYALKAKYISRFKCASEQEAFSKKGVDIYRSVSELIRDIAKSAYAEIDLNPEIKDVPVSALIQSRILNYILDEPNLPLPRLGSLEAVSINSSKSGKNVTIPKYLLEKLGEMLGNNEAARSRVHEVTFSIKQSLHEKGLLDPSGKRIGDAAHSSWSRKIHNILFLDLIELSNIPELHFKRGMLDVEMNRDIKIEI